MGNFYTNITVKAEFPAVLAALRNLRRIAYAASAPGGLVIVVDREIDTQDIDSQASLALTLAARLQAPALAALNHDDDLLLLALYGPGGLVTEFGWSKGENPVPASDRNDFVATARRHFGTVPRAPPKPPPVDGFGRRILLHLLQGLSARFMAIEVHARIAAAAGLPELCVGTGFKYVDNGDFDSGHGSFVRI